LLLVSPAFASPESQPTNEKVQTAISNNKVTAAAAVIVPQQPSVPTADPSLSALAVQLGGVIGSANLQGDLLSAVVKLLQSQPVSIN